MTPVASLQSGLSPQEQHRYELAAELCDGLRVVELHCGSGDGARVLARRARSVTGVDAAAPRTEPRAEREGLPADLRLEVAAPSEFLRRRERAWDAVLWLRRFDQDDVPELLAALGRVAALGTRVIVSIPNLEAPLRNPSASGQALGVDQALALLDGPRQATILLQFLAEGSLIQGDRADEVAAHLVSEGPLEREGAHQVLACMNFDGSAFEAVRLRTHLAASAVTVGHVRALRSANSALEAANEDLRRANVQLAREKMGVMDSAAASLLARLQEAEARLKATEASAGARVAELERIVEITQSQYDAPRYHAVDALRNAILGAPALHRAARAVSKLLAPGPSRSR